MSSKPLVIFDMDGTLADMQHRRHFLDKSPPDWKSFNADVGHDLPNKPVVDLYQTLWQSGHYEIVIATGRMEWQRAATEQWLAWQQIPFARMLMRQDKDNRADNIIKEEILHGLLAEGKTIAFVVDDRDQVVAMWRRNGITCLQCAEGNF